MILVYCFIGKLPEYAVDTIYQARLFYNGLIYFIVDDMESEYIIELKEKYNVIIINYMDVVDRDFIHCVSNNLHRFPIINDLKGREKLFIYSFERFFILYQLMDKYNLTNAFFLELDNLIYDDPYKWEEQFNNKDMSYMYDNKDRCASGICYIKNKDMLQKFNEYCKYYICTTNKFMTEMTSLYEFWELHKNDIQILPTHWPSNKVPFETYMNYNTYNDTIFDSAGLGIYLGGMDPHHTKGVITKGLKSIWSAIDYTHYKYNWKIDEKGRKIPYILYNDKWIRINNLHIHSKDLKSCFSI